MHAFITAVALFAGLASVTAQQGAPSAPARPPQQAAGPAHDTYVLVGCLEAEAGTAPVTGFTLRNATAVGQAPPESDSQPSTVGTAGRSGGSTTGNAAGTRSYQLQANAENSVTQPGIKADALKAEVGHQVQVTVRALDVDAAPAANATSGVTPPTPAAADTRAAARFSVTALTQLEARCR